MKSHTIKIFIILLSAFFNFENSYSADWKNVVSEIILTDKDTTFRINYLYGNQQNVVLETKAFKQYGIWKNLRQTEFYYSNNTKVKQVDRIWSENIWVDNHCIDFIKQNDELIESSSQFMNGLKSEYKQIICKYSDTLLIQKRELYKKNQVWVIQYEFDYQYENNQLKISYYKYFVYNSLGSNFRNTNTYNQDGTLHSVLEESGSNEQNYRPVRLSTWYYQPFTLLLSSQRSKIWKNSLSTWENESMIAYDYNVDNQLISEVFYYWKSMFWEKIANFNYQYNPEGKLVSKDQNEPIYNQWRNTITINYKDLIEDNSQFIESTMGFWGGNKGSLVSSYIPYSFNNEIAIKKAKQIKITRSAYNGVKTIQDIQNQTVKNISIYPNPSDGIFYYSTSDYKVNSWSVFTANGIRIKLNESVVNSGVIDLTDIPKGVYFFVANTAEKVLVQKLIKK